MSEFIVLASQRSSSSRSSYGSTGSDYYYGAPPPDIAVDTGPLKWKPLDIIKEYDNDGFATQSDWSSDASGREGVEQDVVGDVLAYFYKLKIKENMTKQLIDLK